MSPLKTRIDQAVCSPKPALGSWPLLTLEQAAGLERVFKVLANDSRIRLLNVLARSGELCVSDLAQQLGMTQQAVSNQLRKLLDVGILGSRREGLFIHYRIVDPCVVQLIELGLCLMEDSQPRAEGDVTRYTLAGGKR